MRRYLYYVYYNKNYLIGPNSDSCTSYAGLGLYYELAFFKAKLRYI